MPKIASAEKGELVSVRVSPKTKFSLEILARIQRRTVSAIVAMAIEHELRREGSQMFVGEPTGAGGGPGCEGARGDGYLPDRLWDPVEPDRLVRLAQIRPDLLTHQEQLKWKAIRENPQWCSIRAGHEEPEMVAIRRDWAEINRQAEEWERLG